MSDLVKKIGNLQRFELLEERLGLSISNVNAVVVNDGTSADPSYYVNVTAEVIALNGGAVDHDFKINVTASDSDGNGLGGSTGQFLGSSFFGIDRLDVLIKVYSTDVETIKIFPTKW